LADHLAEVLPSIRLGFCHDRARQPEDPATVCGTRAVTLARATHRTAPVSRPGAPTENPEGRPWEVINLLFPSLQPLPSGGDEKTLRRLKEMLQRIML